MGFGVMAWLPARAQSFAPSPEITYEEWSGLCAKLPSYKAARGQIPPRSLLPLKTFAELDRQIGNFFALSVTGELSRAEAWVGSFPEKSRFFDPTRVYHEHSDIPFQPFAQKLMVPPGAEVFFHGDLHGDIHSLMGMVNWMNRGHYLRGFSFARTNACLVILGDFTDRGLYSTEVLYTLLRLKLANPDRVFLCRGNHEDIELMSRYGFLAEGQAKYGGQFDAHKISRIYDFLPAVLYLGCGTNFIQCHHGGLEPGYRPADLLDAAGAARFQIIGKLAQKTFFTAHRAWFAASDTETRATAANYYREAVLTSPTQPTLLGFLWNDFTVLKGETQLSFNAGRGFVYGDALTRLVLTQSGSGANRVRAVFRGHQHSSIPNPLMNRLVEGRGLFRHWQAADSPPALAATGAALKIERDAERGLPDFSVWTFNVAPGTSYGLGNRFQFDTFAILRVAPDFADWKIRVVNQPLAE